MILHFLASPHLAGSRGSVPPVWHPVPLSALEYRLSAVVKAFYCHAAALLTPRRRRSSPHGDGTPQATFGWLDEWPRQPIPGS